MAIYPVIAVVWFFLTGSPAALSTTFYVDTGTGTDTQTGTRPDHAWKSMARVNAALAGGAVGIGDSVLFRRGDTFRGSLVISPAAAPGMTFGAFGDGDRPILDAVDAHDGVTIARSGVLIENLHVANARLALFATLGDVSDIVIRGCTGGDPELVFTTYGLLIRPGRIERLALDTVSFEHVTDAAVSAAGGADIAGLTVQGLSAANAVMGVFIAGARISDVVIEQSTFTGHESCGIRFIETEAARCCIVSCRFLENGLHGIHIQGAVRDIVIEDVTVATSGSHGIYLDTTAARNIRLERAVVTGSGNEKNGIALDGAGQGCKMADCISSYNGGDGFNVHGHWLDVVLTECRADMNGTDGRGSDGDGYTFHDDSTGVMRRCRASNNLKSAVAHVHLCAVRMEHCIFTHDTNGTIPLVYLSGAAFAVLNCVLYSPVQVGMGLQCLAGDITVMNTVVQGFETGMRNGGAAVANDYNIVYGCGGSSWSGLVKGAHSLVSDPLFMDPIHGVFVPSPQSPCVDAGGDDGLNADIRGIPIPQGNRPDIGTYEIE